MALSALDLAGCNWVRSSSYDRLDASEKGAVSYFLGMIQACLMARAKLNVSHLVHVDSALRIIGKRPARKARPDLVGYPRSQARITSGAARLIVESKGRTNRYSEASLLKAKTQVQSLAGPVSLLLGSNYTGVASMAYFDQMGSGSSNRRVRNGPRIWMSYLVDPEPNGSRQSILSDEQFRTLIDIAYYLPTVEAIRSLSQTAPGYVGQRGEFVTANFLQTGVIVAVSARAYEAVSALELPIDPSVLNSQALREAVHVGNIVPATSVVEELGHTHAVAGHLPGVIVQLAGEQNDKSG